MKKKSNTKVALGFGPLKAFNELFQQLNPYSEKTVDQLNQEWVYYDWFQKVPLGRMVPLCCLPLALFAWYLVACLLGERPDFSNQTQLASHVILGIVVLAALGYIVYAHVRFKMMTARFSFEERGLYFQMREAFRSLHEFHHIDGHVDSAEKLTSYLEAESHTAFMKKDDRTTAEQWQVHYATYWEKLLGLSFLLQKTRLHKNQRTTLLDDGHQGSDSSEGLPLSEMMA